MFTCKICKKEFSNYNKLNGHMKTHSFKLAKTKMNRCHLNYYGCEVWTVNRFNCNTCLAKVTSDPSLVGTKAELDILGFDTIGMKGW